MTALAYPNTFGKVIMHSPLVNEDVLEKVKNHQDIHAFSLYHVIGTEEKAVKTGDGLTNRFRHP